MFHFSDEPKQSDKESDGVKKGIQMGPGFDLDWRPGPDGQARHKN